MSSMTDTHNEYPKEAFTSAISWGAIIGGAFAAAAASLALLLLGTALGLSSLSPWSYPDAEAVQSFTVKTAVWIIVMQWLSAGLGGYLTGRLRTKWTGTHTDEVFFRDTAHGFLVWAVATVLAASVLASTATSIVSGGVHATATVTAGEVTGAGNQPAGHSDVDPTGYYIDSLFRSDSPNTSVTAQDVRMETKRLLVIDMKNGGVTDTDKAYLTQLVASRAGLNQVDAAKRVDDTLSQLNTAKEKAKQGAETARKTAMHISLYVFLSMLIGAFIASTAAAIGGRQRDEY